MTDQDSELLSAGEREAFRERKMNAGKKLTLLFRDYVLKNSEVTPENYDQLEEKMENILKGIQIALETEDLELFKSYLSTSLINFLNVRGYNKISEDLMNKLLKANDDTGSVDVANDYVMNNIAQLHMNRGEFQKAIELYVKTLDSYRSKNQITGVIESLIGLGHAYSKMGDYPRSRIAHLEALQHIEKLQKNHYDHIYIKFLLIATGYTEERFMIVRAEILNALGTLETLERNYDLARKYISESLKIYEEQHNIYGQAQVLHNMGSLLIKVNEYDEALQAFEKSLVINQELGNKYMVSGAYHQIGTIHLYTKNFTLAKVYLAKSYELAFEIDDKYFMSESLFNLGKLHMEQLNLPEARNFMERSLEIKESISSGTLLVTLDTLIIVCVGSRDFDSARKYLQKYIDYSKKEDNIPELIKAYATLAAMFAGEKKQIEAQLHLNYALNYKKALKDSLSTTVIHRLANAAFIMENHDLAIQFFNESLSIDPANAKEVGDLVHQYGVALYKSGEVEHARDYFTVALKIRVDIEDKEANKTLSHLGSAYSSLGNFAEMEGDLRKAIELWQISVNILSEFLNIELQREVMRLKGAIESARRRLGG